MDSDAFDPDKEAKGGFKYDSDGIG